MQNKNNILYRQIQSGLQATIVVHGPIHKKFVSSATKRIIGTLNKFEKISYPDEPLKEALMVLAAKRYTELLQLRKKLKQDNLTNEQKSFLGGRTGMLGSILTELVKIGKLHYEIN